MATRTSNAPRLGPFIPAYALAALLAVVAIFSGFYLQAGVALLGYGLLALLCLAFLKYPRATLLAALGLKPVIDMFWWTKGVGLLSPLFLAGVLVPVLALLALPRVARRRLRLPEDRLVIAYLAVFLVLTLCKIVATPQFLMNSIEHYIRILSVTAFYFIGKYYFPTVALRRRLAVVLALSSVIPFVLTAGQEALGVNLTNWRDVGSQASSGLGTGYISAFYISGRHNLDRISGVYEGVYTLAFLGVFTVLILLAARLSRDVRFHPAGYLLFGLGAYFTYFTYSRSAWVTLVLAATLFFVVRREYRRVAVLALGAVVLYATVETVRFRFEDEIGFVAGSSDFAKFGYGRGGKWTDLIDVFFSRDALSQLIGTYGEGNPENQFLNVLFWFGYSGLIVFVLFLVLMTVRLWGWLSRVRLGHSFDMNMRVLFACLVIVCYWFAGLGNNFFLQISTQWTLWIWTGVILAAASQDRVAARGKRGPATAFVGPGRRLASAQPMDTSVTSSQRRGQPAVEA